MAQIIKISVTSATGSPSLTQEQLKELLHYDSDTGTFTWVDSRGRVASGDVAGSPQSMGYLSIRINGRLHLAHRLAWLYSTGEWPKYQIDHINGIRTDNRISNLRDVTANVNQQNQRRGQSGGKTGLLGVSLYKKTGKYRSEIMCFGAIKFLGYFDTAPEAHAAYVKAKREIHEGCTI